MNKIIRRSNDRLLTKISWLKSFHTFSFGEHYDPNWMGFRNLRVINDDYIEANQGFPRHPHSNMEIITFMLEGRLKHQDSLGNKMTIMPGELQVMSAGTGITHSEYSESETNLVHLLQIWIMPKDQNIPPRYAQKKIQNENENNFLKIIASEDKSDAQIMFLNARANIWQGSFDSVFEQEFIAKTYKNLWIHVFAGEIKIKDDILSAGDSMGVENLNSALFISNDKNNKAEFLIFELE